MQRGIFQYFIAFSLLMPGFLNAQDVWQLMTAQEYHFMKPGPEKSKWLQQVEDNGWFYKNTYYDLKGNLIESPQVDLSPVVDDKGETVFLVTEIDPEFPGGQLSFEDYLQNALGDLLSKPGGSVQNSIPIKFSIEKDGSIAEVEPVGKILEWIPVELLQKCRQTIEEMPNWSPGIYKGKPVKVKMLFTFSLRE